MKAVTLRLLPGEDVKATLDKFTLTQNIKAACVVTCVGSLQQAAIRYANQPDTDIIIGKYEIVSLTGTLSINGTHLHIAISDNAGKMIGGHLKEGALVYTTVEIVIAILPDVVYKRETDHTYGYKELVIIKAEAKQ